MTYILAGNKGQFNHYVRLHGIDDAVCVTSMEQLRGLRDQKLIRYGTWWERGLRVIEQLRAHGWTIIDAKD
jgi:hypothetical protein